MDRMKGTSGNTIPFCAVHILFYLLDQLSQCLFSIATPCDENKVDLLPCYVQVERLARLEWSGCDQDVWLSDGEASASGTQLERWGCGNRDDTW